MYWCYIAVMCVCTLMHSYCTLSMSFVGSLKHNWSQSRGEVHFSIVCVSVAQYDMFLLRENDCVGGGGVDGWRGGGVCFLVVLRVYRLWMWQSMSCSADFFLGMVCMTEHHCLFLTTAIMNSYLWFPRPVRSVGRKSSCFIRVLF